MEQDMDQNYGFSIDPINIFSLNLEFKCIERYLSLWILSSLKILCFPSIFVKIQVTFSNMV